MRTLFAKWRFFFSLPKKKKLKLTFVSLSQTF